MYFLSYLEELLSKMFLVEFAKFPQAKTTKVGEEYAAALLHLALHKKNQFSVRIFRPLPKYEIMRKKVDGNCLVLKKQCHPISSNREEKIPAHYIYMDPHPFCFLEPDLL